jgi:uncharacterized protein YjbI with pentapeptide repeats
MLRRGQDYDPAMPEITRLARDVVGKVWPRVTAWTDQGWQWVRRNPRTALWVGGVTVGAILLVLLIADWKPYSKHYQAFAPIFALAAGLAIAGVTLMRHFAQTEADRQRRIIESFSKAIEQLGSDKLEVRLGGIYALERISQESPQDYWTVMENLTAFVRERTQRTEAERTAKPLDQRIAAIAYSLWEKAGKPEGRSEEFWTAAAEEEKLGEPPATDIAAVLTVIKRRSEGHRALETRDKKVLDFSQAVLRRADLLGVHLDGADLNAAHLEGAVLHGAHLEHAVLNEAHLEGAGLYQAHLEHAVLNGAHLEHAVLNEAHLEQAVLNEAHLERAYLGEAHLERAVLNGAHLEGAALWEAHLERAGLHRAHLEGAGLHRAHLEGAGLWEAYLEGAGLHQAHLERAYLGEAHLERAVLFEGADLDGAHLEGAYLHGAHLDGADLSAADGLTQEQIDEAIGDAETQLPEGLTRPAHWTDPTAPAP